MATSIKPNEQETTREFIRIVNDIRLQHNAGPLSTNTARKFLMARRFDLNRALSLYDAHELTRFREGLAKFDPTKDPVKTELETGKFTVLQTRDSSGAAIVMFTACKHIPTDTSHQTTLQGVVYQLDIALEDPDTQKNGMVFIYNMSGSKYGNFDYELSQKILSLLKGAYPARLKKVLIVTAPLWFKAPFKILRLFVREKLRDRVFMLNLSQLPSHIPMESLPKDLGGLFHLDHKAWINTCFQSSTENVQDLYDLGNFGPLSSTCQLQNGAIESVNCINSLSSGDDESQANGNFSEEDDNSSNNSGKCDKSGSNFTSGQVKTVQNQKPKPENIIVPMIHGDVNGKNEQVSGDHVADVVHSENDHGMNLEDFIQYMKRKGRKGLYEEYNFIRCKAPDGQFIHARLPNNQTKNRYSDVLCYDHSRVKLLPKMDTDEEKIEEDDCEETDYINANFVDGYMQPNAFISTQGPLPKTFSDFWRMVWQQQVLVIVMTTRTVERSRTKCGQYFPLEEGSSMEYYQYKIVNKGVHQFKDYMITNLSVYHENTNSTREVTHMQFMSWPDYGVPLSALAMLDFREKVREQQAKSLSAIGSSWKGHGLGPPIVVHCSAGIGRTGTFITLDISILRLEATGLIAIKDTVAKIRAQRAYSIQMPDQYVFCYLALLEYALVRNLLQDVDLSGFEEESDLEE